MALLLVSCFWLLLGCNLQPFALIGCNLLRYVYHLGGFQKLLEASFYKGDKNQKPFAFLERGRKPKKTFAFYKGAENHNHFINVGVFAALMVVSVT